MKGITLAALAALLAVQTGPAAAGERHAGAEEIRDLTGIWTSTAPEPWYGGFGTRHFTFGNGRWSLVFTHALDPDMRMKTFAFRTEGAYDVGPASTVVPGAFDVLFHEDVKLVTLLTADAGLVEAFGFAGCGLVEGAEVDVSEKGCAGWKPVSVCSEDHDLVALGPEGLHFGVRPADNDMCTPDRRPTALLPAVVRQ